MGVGKYALFVFLLLVLSPVSFADVSYSLVTDLSNSATVLHDDSHTITLEFTNTNFACTVSCSARMESSFYNTPNSEFTITTSNPVPKSFILRSPSKKEASYKPDGALQYSLNIECSTVPVFILCQEGPEDATASTSDSNIFTLNYGLSSSEKQAKSEYEALVNSIQNDIESLYNRGNELNSFYGNLIRNVLIPSDVQEDVSRLSLMGEETFKIFEESQKEYKVLNVKQSLSTLSPYENTNYDDLLSDIANTQEKLIELQKRHDTIVQDLKDIQQGLSDNSEELQRAGLSTQYFDLVSTYEKLQSDLNTLKFSSYESIESRVSQLNANFDDLLELKKQEEQKVVDLLKEMYLVETTKINSQIKLFVKPTLTLTINQFCSDFEISIPQQFREYNDDQQSQVDAQNQRNEERNQVLESMRTSWLKLVNLIDAITSTAKDKVFDESLIQGCDVNSVLKDNFQQNDLNNVLTKCQSYQATLGQSIQDNQKFTSRLLNFFKYLFGGKPKLNQTMVPDLNTLMKPTNLIYTPIGFSEKTIAGIGEYCEFNPQSVTLQAPNTVGDIGYDTSNQVIEFPLIQGSCEVLDCYNNRGTFPILFVHGHMFTDSTDPMVESRYTFDNMVDYISNRHNNAYDAGTIVDNGNEFLDSGLKTNPGVALFRTTYYGNAYIDSSGKFQFQTRNYESIETYADKLKNIIDATLETTGRSKVKIVSHSMGGLVVREYLSKYGSSKVDTFIMIGTPNQGTEGLSDSGCAAFGADIECEQMGKGSDFLQTLSQNDELPPRTFIISGTYSNKDTDAVVLRKNTEITGVEQFNYQSSKTYIAVLVNKLLSNDLVHGDLIQPNIMSKVSDKVSELLELD